LKKTNKHLSNYLIIIAHDIPNSNDHFKTYLVDDSLKYIIQRLRNIIVLTLSIKLKFLNFILKAICIQQLNLFNQIVQLPS